MLIEDTGARKALVFEHGGVVGFLSPWPEAINDGKANLKIYGKAFSLRYGEDFAGDTRFAVYPVGCPTGHNFGFMLVNKAEIRIKPGMSATGPEGYFKIAVDRIDGGDVVAWHVEDAKGNRSANLGGTGVGNVDLVLGQGRVAGQAILKDVGRAMLERNYQLLLAATNAAPSSDAGDAKVSMAPAVTHVSSSPISSGLMAAFGMLVIACGAVGYEIGRRRAKTS